jgi:SecD/SecF fusion protein
VAPSAPPTGSAPRRSRYPWLYLVIAVAVVLAGLAVTGAVVAWRSWPERPGGGETVVLRVGSPTDTVAPATLEEVAEIARHRVEGMGAGAPEVSVGEVDVTVELPRGVDADAAGELMARPGELTLRPVLGVSREDAAVTESQTGDPEVELHLPDPDSDTLLHLGPTAIGNADVASAEAAVGPNGDWQVGLVFHDQGGEAWTRMTGDAACHPVGDRRRRIAIVLDGEILSAPEAGPDLRCDAGITEPEAVIAGDFTRAEAEELANLVRLAPLPMEVAVRE